jgi:hypothetical protein
MEDVGDNLSVRNRCAASAAVLIFRLQTRQQDIVVRSCQYCKLNLSQRNVLGPSQTEFPVRINATFIHQGHHYTISAMPL